MKWDSLKDLLVSGEDIGHSPDRCYLSVFFYEPTPGTNDYWFMGNIWTQNYYISFDQSPSADKNLTFNLIGLAKSSENFDPWAPVPSPPFNKLWLLLLLIPVVLILVLIIFKCCRKGKTEV